MEAAAKRGVSLRHETGGRGKALDVDRILGQLLEDSVSAGRRLSLPVLAPILRCGTPDRSS